jgi:hypothetical protein
MHVLSLYREVPLCFEYLMADGGYVGRATPTSTWFSNIQVAACLGLVVGRVRCSVVSRCSNEPLGRVAADGRWKV